MQEIWRLTFQELNEKDYEQFLQYFVPLKIHIDPFEYYKHLEDKYKTEKRRLSVTKGYADKRRKIENQKWGETNIHRPNTKQSFQKTPGDIQSVNSAKDELDLYYKNYLSIFSKKEIKTSDFESDYSFKEIFKRTVKKAIKDNKYKMAIKNGEMTNNEAVKIIESADEQIPTDIKNNWKLLFINKKLKNYNISDSPFVYNATVNTEKELISITANNQRTAGTMTPEYISNINDIKDELLRTAVENALKKEGISKENFMKEEKNFKFFLYGKDKNMNRYKPVGSLFPFEFVDKLVYASRFKEDDKLPFIKIETNRLVKLNAKENLRFELRRIKDGKVYWNSDKTLINEISKAIKQHLKQRNWVADSFAKGGKIASKQEISILDKDVEFDKEKYSWILGDYDNDGIANIDDIAPMNPNISGTIEQRSLADSFEGLLETRKEFNQKMIETIEHIKPIAPKDSKIYARTKTPYSIIQKLIKKKLLDKKNPSAGLTDVVGTTIVVKDYEQLTKVGTQIETEFEVNEREDFYPKPLNGYRAIHYILLIDKFPVELQLKTLRMKQINEVSHKPYAAGVLNGKELEKITDIANKADNGDNKAKEQFNEIVKNTNKLEKRLTLEKFDLGGIIAPEDPWVEINLKSFAKGGKTTNKDILFDKAKERVSTQAINVLEEAEIDHNSVTFDSGIIDRNTYNEVKDILTRVGGKWKGRGKNKDGSPKGSIHFDRYNPKIIVDAIIKSGIKPSKNPTDYFPTPQLIVNDMFQGKQYYWKEDPDILEPSAGTGALADEAKKLMPGANIDTVEYLPVNAEILKNKGHKVVYEGDFLKWNTAKKYDFVFMNPPFGRNIYIDHILKAWSMLKNTPDSQLLAIVPATLYSSQKKVKEFWDTVAIYGGIEVDYFNQEFKESGTNVNTVMIRLEQKSQGEWKFKGKYNGFENHALWLYQLYIDQERELTDDLETIFKKVDIKKYFKGEKSDFHKKMKPFIKQSLNLLRRKKILFALPEEYHTKAIENIEWKFEEWTFYAKPWDIPILGEARSLKQEMEYKKWTVPERTYGYAKGGKITQTQTPKYHKGQRIIYKAIRQTIKSVSPKPQWIENDKGFDKYPEPVFTYDFAEFNDVPEPEIDVIKLELGGTINNFVPDKSSLDNYLKSVIDWVEEEELYNITTSGFQWSETLTECTFDKEDALSDFEDYKESERDIKTESITAQICKVYEFDFDEIFNLLKDDYSDFETDDLSFDDIATEVKDYMIENAEIEPVEEIAHHNYADERKEEEAKEEEKYNTYLSELIADFKEQYKDYIQDDESAGFGGSSYYATLLMDSDENLVPFKEGLFLRENEDATGLQMHNSGETFERNYIVRKKKLGNKDYAVIQIRISDHEQNPQNIDDITDAGLSISVKTDYLDQSTREGYEERNRDLVAHDPRETSKVTDFRGYGNDSEYEFDYDDLFQDYKMLYKNDDEYLFEANPLDVIDYFIKEISYESMIESRSTEYRDLD